MEGRSSTSLLAVIALVILGLIAGDKCLGLLAARRAPEPANEQDLPVAAWSRHSFPRIGLTVQLPSDPSPLDSTLSAQGRLNVTRFERYHGDTTTLQYEVGRCMLTDRIRFSSDVHFQREEDHIRSAEGVTNFKLVDERKFQWHDAPTVERTYSFDEQGVPTKLHHRLRIGPHDWIYLEGWYHTNSASNGDEAWSKMIGSLSIETPR